MNWLTKLLGLGIDKPIDSLGNALDKLFTSKDEKLSHEEARMRIMNEPSKFQTELNKIEATHRSWFVAGWRPFIGWVCGVALAYGFIFRDIFAWLMRIFYPTIEAPPELALEHLMTILLGMLGLGGMRTYEKLKDKTK